MTFNDREQAFEAKFTMDQQSMFKIEARASKLIGLWAAGQFGLSGADADNYAKEVIAANLDEPGYNDVKRKLKADFESRNIPFPSAEIDTIVNKCVVDATRQVEAESR